MDTSVLMASEEPNISVLENPRQSGSRRKLKSNEPAAKKKKKEKQPQRGMGVEKLERERMRSLNQQSPLLPSHYFLPATYPDPPRTAIVGGGYGQLGLDQALFLQSLGYVGLGPGENHGLGRVGPYYGFGAAMDMGLRGGSYSGENSKELSSIPNPVRCPSDQCGLCHKKKRLNGGNLGGCNAMREKYVVDPSLINGCSFNGFNVPNSRQNNHGINFDKGVEVVGVHKKGNSGAFMEYEFFPPGKGGRSTSTNDLDLSLFSEASVAAALLGGGGGGGERSCVTTTTTTTTTTTASTSTGFDASTSIDLSLKLSY